jgi:hypothetical protein
MSVFYQLLDVLSGNIVTEFETEEEAIAALCRVGRDHGLAEIDHLALLRFEDGHPSLVAMDDDLVTWVRKEIDNPVMTRSVV